MPVTATPWPTVPAEFCSGLLAKISPKDACDFLKPVVPTLAMLLLVTASSVLAARNPVNEVKKRHLCFRPMLLRDALNVFKRHGFTTRKF